MSNANRTINEILEENVKSKARISELERKLSIAAPCKECYEDAAANLQLKADLEDIAGILDRADGPKLTAVEASKLGRIVNKYSPHL